MQNNKINLLVLTDLFPRFQGDMKGIFVLDYVNSVKRHCNIKVFATTLLGHHKSGKNGLNIEKKRGVEVYNYYFSAKRLPSLLKNLSYILWSYKVWNIGRSFKNTDIIHCHGSSILGALGILISKKLKAPIVLTHHTNPASKLTKNFIIRNLSNFSFSNADAVLTVSNWAKKDLLDYSFSPKKIYVTYNPVDTVLFNIKERQDFKKAKNIIFVGRLVEYKGAFLLVKSFQEVLKKFKDWKLTIIGEGPEYDIIKNYIQNNGDLKSKVILKGILAKADISDELKKASILVVPSEHETFSIVVAEAMASGLPVIVGKNTAPTEFIDEECGTSVPVKDSLALSRSISSMIENLDRYDSNYIRDKIEQNFSFEEFGKRLLAIYRQFI